MSERLEILPVVHISVALIELTDDDGKTSGFVVESRPSGNNLTNPGKMGFFGGHREAMEDPWATGFREIDEELAITATRRDWQEKNLANPDKVLGKDKFGNRVLYVISLFQLTLPVGSTARVTRADHGEAVVIPATPETVEAHRPRLIPYAHQQMTAFLAGTGHWERKEPTHGFKPSVQSQKD